jgi:hypothetical protein
MLNVQAIEYRGRHRLWLRFNDGAEGEVDLAPHLVGPVFVPLRDPAVFAAVRLDPELRTIVWPNGADLAPEFLHSLLGSDVAAV